MLSETVARLEWIRKKIGEKEKTNLSSGLETNDHTISCLQCLLGFFHYGRNFHTHAVKIVIQILSIVRPNILLTPIVLNYHCSLFRHLIVLLIYIFYHLIISCRLIVKSNMQSCVHSFFFFLPDRPTHLHEREGDGKRNILWGWPK